MTTHNLHWVSTRSPLTFKAWLNIAYISCKKTDHSPFWFFWGVCVTFIILNTAVSGNIDRRQAITRKLTCIYCQVVKSLLRQDWICLPGKDLICLQCFCSQKPFLQACYSALLLATNCHHPLQHLCGLQLAIKWLMMMSKETTLTSLTNHRNMRVFASTLCDLVSIVANYLITEYSFGNCDVFWIEFL